MDNVLEYLEVLGFTYINDLNEWDEWESNLPENASDTPEIFPCMVRAGNTTPHCCDPVVNIHIVEIV